jgi:hypothetical protein
MKKTLLLLILSYTLISGTLQAQNNPFITRWDLTKAGSGSDVLGFGVATSGTVNYT